jgi:hypothetical protein
MQQNNKDAKHYAECRYAECRGAILIADNIINIYF